ncbi:alpha/beta hydrolase [uncultured Ruminobacter sp.]|jgi:esterase FrsA|uniref:alpha/beta hydrolase n=1 Tax=uncultured Ruminobacter sp. TaxID=538947 RepID=UPI0025D86A5F|nr:alpha/beta hydrolase [uncultured Ruminobacter sp.]
MTEISSENLSEVLFKPHRSSLETSFISNSVDELLPNRDGSPRRWFRDLHRDYWSWMGLDILEIQKVVSDIAGSENKRTREGVLDTVYEYGPGNWVYEFSMLAEKHASHARSIENDPDAREEAFKHFRLAYLCYALASYPHLKGDEMANHALLMNHVNYKKAAGYVDGHFEIIKFKSEAGEGTAYVHTPDKNQCLPCVIICGNYVNLATEYLRFYRENLYPNGVAMITLDLPGMGMNSNIPLTANTGVLHEALLDYVKENLPYINRMHIGIIAQRFGCNCATHLLVSHSSDIRVACMIAPIVNDVMVDPELLKLASPIQRTSMCNRMGTDAAEWENLIPRLQTFSVKRQGLISGVKLKTPMLVVSSDRKSISSIGDAKLLGGISENTEFMELKANTAFELFTKVIDQVSDWLKERL